MSSIFWTVVDDHASLKTSVLEAKLEVLHPWNGLQKVITANDAWRGSFLGAITAPTFFGAVARQPETLVEVYQRGPDLVATYAETPERNVRPQLYWRYVEQQADAVTLYGVELVASVQTSLLDSQPLLNIETSLTGVSAWRLRPGSHSRFDQVLPGDAWSSAAGEPGVALFRGKGHQQSYVEMVHPTDFHSARNTSAETVQARLAWQLFPEHLEKGVIRRGRIRGMFVPQEQDEALALACYEAFRDSPLVLSA